MLKLSKKLDYAVAILVYLVKKGESKISSAKEIASSFKLPLPITSALLKILTKHEIVRSIRGIKGGYIISIKPSELTMDKIILAIDGPIRLADCVSFSSSKHSKRCLLKNCCPVVAPIRKLHSSIVDLMAKITLKQIANESDDIEF